MRIILNIEKLLADGYVQILDELKTTTVEVKTNKDKEPDCPHGKIIDLYHEKLPYLRNVRQWTAQRQAILRNRWKEHPNLKWWEEFFDYVSESKFLIGVSSDFSADLEWLIRPRNFVKVVEGKYHEER